MEWVFLPCMLLANRREVKTYLLIKTIKIMCWRVERFSFTSLYNTSHIMKHIAKDWSFQRPVISITFFGDSILKTLYILIENKPVAYVCAFK